MGQTISQELQDTRSLLLKKLEQNEDLSNVLVALLGKLILTYQHTPGIRMMPMRSAVANDYQEFSSRIEIVNLQLQRNPRIIAKNDLGDYMAAKNIALASVINSNKDVADFFQELVERIDKYADWKKIPFAKVRVVQGGAFITPDNLFVIRVSKKSILDMTPFNRFR